MSTHRIHLKGPWEFEWLSPTPDEGLPPPALTSERECRITMPVDWQTAFGTRSGKVRFRRRFHRPTNLEPHETVSIVFDGVGGAATVFLNGRHLGIFTAAGKGSEFDITGLLGPSNVLCVEIEFDPARAGGQNGGLWAPVALEIRSPLP